MQDFYDEMRDTQEFDSFITGKSSFLTLRVICNQRISGKNISASKLETDIICVFRYGLMRSAALFADRVWEVGPKRKVKIPTAVGRCGGTYGVERS